MAQCSHVLCLCPDGHADQGGYFSEDDGLRLLDILLGVFSSIEMANNEKIHMPALLKYVEVTGLPFKVSTVPKKRKPGTSRKK